MFLSYHVIMATCRTRPNNSICFIDNLQDLAEHCVCLAAQPGDLCSMEGAFQRHYSHQIAKAHGGQKQTLTHSDIGFQLTQFPSGKWRVKGKERCMSPQKQYC